MASENSADIHKLVQAQFGPVANAYTTSAGHSDPTALQHVVELAQPKPTDRALDIATGAGHTGLALAPHVAHVVLYDITPQMLEEAARNARQAGISNFDVQEGPAETLPFTESLFDIITVRVAPHHFADINKAVHEMVRVLKPGGRVVVVDTTVPEDVELDRQINYIEKLRDPSHVRNYRPSEWRSMLEAAGLQVNSVELDTYTEQGKVDFAIWTSRMRTPPAAVAELESLFRQASPGLQEALEIQVDGDKIGFVLRKVTLAATK